VSPSRDRVRQHRERLRQQGLRPIEFVREAHRQSVLVAASAQDVDDQAFVDATSSDWDDAT
jgi:hypothetical protein